MSKTLTKYFNISYYKNKVRKIEYRIKTIFSKNINSYSSSMINIFNIFNEIINKEPNNEFELNTNFLDRLIEDCTMEFFLNNRKLFKSQQECKVEKIGIIYTEIYNISGEAPVIESFVNSFVDEYEIKGYATMNSNECQSSLIKSINIKKYHWLNYKALFDKYFVKLYNDIVNDKISIIITYGHPHDILLYSVISLLKNNTKIKIIYFNLADHNYNLGYRFAHLILDARPSGQKITRNIRGYNNTVLMPLQQKLMPNKMKLGSIRSHFHLKQELGIKTDNYITITGGSGYKFFDNNSKSEYFELIKSLLQEDVKIIHIIMSEFSEKQYKIIRNLFSYNKNLLKRLVIIPRNKIFYQYMKIADLFIDTFPQGGALIHIDAMYNKIPSVIKINKTNPVKSFEYYLPKNYEYKYNNIKDMKRGILKLLYNETERKEVSNYLYNYYLKTYEFNTVKNKYKTIISNANVLEKFYGHSFYEDFQFKE